MTNSSVGFPQFYQIKQILDRFLGATEQLYLKTDNEEYIANVNARDFHSPGDRIRVGFDINKAHFFDKETQMAIVDNPIPIESMN